MNYRTRTYIAGDWDNDNDAINLLYEWNNNDHLNLEFIDVHKDHQSNDSSLDCSIKKSLSDRMDLCKTFVLIVGDKTITTTAGSCLNCKGYYKGICLNGHSVSAKSYIQFECDKAQRDGLKIVVLYNSRYKYLENCPNSLRYTGTHLAMKYRDSDGLTKWNYDAIKRAIME